MEGLNKKQKLKLFHYKNTSSTNFKQTFLNIVNLIKNPRKVGAFKNFLKI